MKAIEFIASLVVATALALAGMPANAQDPRPATAAAPTVPEIVQAAYLWGDFDELERLYAIYGKAGLRSEETGNPRIQHFWMGIGKVSSSGLRVTDEYYVQLEALTQKWARDHPRSVLAQLLYADALESHAWAIRGSGYANTVSPAAWTGFHEHLDLALAQLRRTETLAARDSSWNAQMLSVGRGLGWDTDHLMAVFKDGIAKNPDHDSLYFTMLTALLPKWGGDLDTIDRFIDQSVQATREKRGMEMYARLYAGLSYGEVDQALFTTTSASWSLMKVGFEDLLKRYPHVDHRNMYAYFACMADDRAALRQQLELIGDGFDPIFWGSQAERTFDACRKTARQG